ncbi:MAG: ABC-F family ATP-binding cassette domain-containing protein [Chloroflexota bacterium]|nr:ABC-F family ATP-binding cassette domain-containing protein [Chloroflexota bacterium]MDE2908270.1 ABC-F family ATP-binding cassette domain-containing protein [Chloroflexota bacterium]
MQILRVNNIAVSYADREVFRDLSWAIGDRDRVALVGPNGAGKSTLFRVLLGEVAPDRGHVAIQRGLRIGCLPQDVNLPPGKSLIETAMIKPPALAETEDSLSEIEARLADPSVYGDASRLAQTLERHEALLADYERMNGGRHASHVRELLAMLGFEADDYDRPTRSLSGGQKKMVALARLAVAAPEILLLDEPDNHLDMDGKNQLERFILNYRGSVVIISHDRYLLDEVAQQTVELERGRLTVYHGNYSYYLNERQARRLRQQQQFVTQQKEIARIEAMIERFESWAKQVLSRKHMLAARQRRRMLEKMEERGEIIEKVSDQRLMDLKLDGWRGSKKVLELKRVSMAFDDDPLFLDASALLRHGERVGLIGPNGAGKTVLLKLILGELQPAAGDIVVGPSIRIGFYSQEHQTLDAWLAQTPLELVRNMQNSSESNAVNFLLRMAFSYEQTRQPIRTLSGGERSRLQLARVMLQQPNLLLLDEPTNNLDIASVEVLEDALDEFNGTVLIVSHDRYFLDQTVDRLIEIRDGQLREYVGGYTEYLVAAGRLKAG